MTGAMTFGCKIDGRVFVPRDGKGQPGLYSEYLNLGLVRGGGYMLNISAIDWPGTGHVNVGTDSLLVEEGKTYEFHPTAGNAQAFFNSDDKYEKLDQDEGELTITRFDRRQGILAGRFHFVGTSRVSGKQVHVTEGRFDVRF